MSIKDQPPGRNDYNRLKSDITRDIEKDTTKEQLDQKTSTTTGSESQASNQKQDQNLFQQNNQTTQSSIKITWWMVLALGAMFFVLYLNPLSMVSKLTTILYNYTQEGIKPDKPAQTLPDQIKKEPQLPIASILQRLDEQERIIFKLKTRISQTEDKLVAANLNNIELEEKINKIELTKKDFKTINNNISLISSRIDSLERENNKNGINESIEDIYSKLDKIEPILFQIKNKVNSKRILTLDDEYTDENGVNVKKYKIRYVNKNKNNEIRLN